MKFKTKAILSIMLVICIAFCSVIPSFAKTQTAQSEEDKDLVTMYLCATANSLTGHLWLYFTNLTDYTLEIGYVQLKPHESMAVGSLPNSLYDGGGTYYNAENYMASDPETVKNHTTSMKINLDAEQLSSVSEQIKSKNYYNLITYNCGNFATDIWNSVSDKHIVHIIFPALTILIMRLHGAEKGALYMVRPNISEVFKQTDSGVIPANEKSFTISYVG